mgnify:FL=1
MTELNGNVYRIQNVTANTFTLSDKDSSVDIDGTGYTAYTSGGTIASMDNITYSSGGAAETAINLTKVSGVTFKDGSKVTVRLGETHAGKEYYWTGYEFKLSQQKTGVNYPPLFNLYDTNGKTLDDTVEYSSSTFAGNKIFGYKVGS